MADIRHAVQRASKPERATVYHLKLEVDKSPHEAKWACETGDEWNATHIVFRLEAAGSGTLLCFTHAGWNTTWGELMYRIRAAAEGKSRGPLFLSGAVAY